MSKSSVKTVFKNIAPAVVVMVAGLTGAYMVYDSYFNQGVTHYSAIAPASGDVAVATEEADIVVEAAIDVTAPTAEECAAAAEAVAAAAVEGAAPAADVHVATHAQCTEAPVVTETVTETTTEEVKAGEGVKVEETAVTPENAADAATEAAVEAAE